MKHLPECYGIIPARYASSRFPGKPMADILGKPMFWHVYHQACKCPLLKSLVLATDDDRIYSSAKHYNIPVVMTRNDHPSGTDRVLEAATLIKVPESAVVVNIQGDEPTLDPAMLTELVQPFENKNIRVTTLANRINKSEAANPNRVKVVLSKNRDALYFSRSPIPYPRDNEKTSYYGHVGLYAFRMDTLKQFVSMDTGVLENTEKLEQLRLLENCVPIHVVITSYKGIGVDIPEDLIVLTQLLQTKKHSL